MILIGIAVTVLFPDKFKSLFHSMKLQWSRAPFWIKGGSFIAFFLTLACCANTITHVDTALYHVQAINWIKSHGLVPGLGNLHSRFAYNSHFFLPEALFSFFFSQDMIILPVNSFLFLLFFSTMLYHLSKGVKKNSVFKVSFFIIILGLSTYHLLPEVNSSSTDIVVSILVLFAFLVFLNTEFSDKTIPEFILLLVLIGTSLTYKLSSFFLVLLVPFALHKMPLRVYHISSILALVIFLPFLYRNYYLSGYLVYPLPSIDLFDPEWKIPKDYAETEKTFIENYAKLTYQENLSDEMNEVGNLSLGFTAWIPDWLSRVGLKWKTLLLFCIGSLVSLVLSLVKGQRKIASILIVALFNLCYWFFTAPNPRFAYPFIFIIVALSISYPLHLLLQYIRVQRIPNSFAAMVLVFVFFVATLKVVPTFKSWSVTQLLVPLPYTVPETKILSINDIEIRTPTQGRNCYNAPIPCTPFPADNLQKRKVELKDGFLKIQ